MQICRNIWDLCILLNIFVTRGKYTFLQNILIIWVIIPPCTYTLTYFCINIIKYYRKSTNTFLKSDVLFILQ